MCVCKMWKSLWTINSWQQLIYQENVKWLKYFQWYKFIWCACVFACTKTSFNSNSIFDYILNYDKKKVKTNEIYLIGIIFKCKCCNNGDNEHVSDLWTEPTQTEAAEKQTGRQLLPTPWPRSDRRRAALTSSASSAQVKPPISAASVSITGHKGIKKEPPTDLWALIKITVR